MFVRYLASASALALASVASPAFAQSSAGTDAEPSRADEATSQDSSSTIIVTATRRAESLQDVPLAVTAFGQQELTEKGIFGYEGLAQETPGIVLNRPTANFNNFTVRGIATNGYGANLQGTVAIYIDELPISANGNSTILDPTLFDVERVEILRGPQGTLFGANSLAGAVRFITKRPDSSGFDAEAVVDIGLTDGDALRQRYNAMINVPIVEGKLAFRAVGFYRNEEGWVDNIGTGIANANSLDTYGGRAMLLWEPTDRFSIKAMVLHENSTPDDSGLTNPNLGTYVRLSDQPDLFHANLDSYNLTVEWDLGFADFVSSSTLAEFDQLFVVDLAATFGQAFPFGLDAFAYDDVFVQELRLASTGSGPLEWIIGGFYFDRTRTTDFNYRSTLDFLQQRGLTGLPDQYYQRQTTDTFSEELAAFGELTYRFSDNFWLTGGLRYTETSVQTVARPGGYNSNYLLAGLFGLSNIPLTVTDVPGGPGLKITDDSVSWKVSASVKPSDEVTAYATVATGFRSPIANAFAGRASITDPTDIIIPDGAVSDSLTNYEVGVKGSWLGGNVSATIALYYIDWKDIQVQANRVSDSIQFATNIGGATSQGVEFELFVRPVKGLSLAVNGSFNDSEITDLTAAEAAISGAEPGLQLTGPQFQGSATLRYDFALSGTSDAWVSANVAHVDEFPGLFPNVPGRPGVRNPTFDFTERYSTVNLFAGAEFGDVTVIAYVENLFDNDAITYVHPEAFLDSRYARLRPMTFGTRVNVRF